MIHWSIGRSNRFADRFAKPFTDRFANRYTDRLVDRFTNRFADRFADFPHDDLLQKRSGIPGIMIVTRFSSILLLIFVAFGLP